MMVAYSTTAGRRGDMSCGGAPGNKASTASSGVDAVGHREESCLPARRGDPCRGASSARGWRWKDPDAGPRAPKNPSANPSPASSPPNGHRGCSRSPTSQARRSRRRPITPGPPGPEGAPGANGCRTRRREGLPGAPGCRVDRPAGRRRSGDGRAAGTGRSRLVAGCATPAPSCRPSREVPAGLVNSVNTVYTTAAACDDARGLSQRHPSKDDRLHTETTATTFTMIPAPLVTSCWSITARRAAPPAGRRRRDRHRHGRGGDGLAMWVTLTHNVDTVRASTRCSLIPAPSGCRRADPSHDRGTRRVFLPRASHPLTWSRGPPWR